MTSTSPLTLDHRKPRRLRERDALDIAHELLSESRAGHYPLRLWLLPTGEFFITRTSGEAHDGLLQHNAASLVGTYSGEAMACDIVEDVWTRAEQFDREWVR